MSVSDRLSAPERERIVPGDSALACLRRDCDGSQTDLEALQYWPEKLRRAGEEGRPRSGDGTLRCPAPRPGAPHALASDD
jgi:hypothetical protein